MLCISSGLLLYPTSWQLVMVLIKKEDLIKILTPYTSLTSKFLISIRLKPSSEKVVALTKLIMSLPPGELTLVQLLNLCNLLTIKANDASAIQLSDSLKKALEHDWRYMLIHSLHTLWKQSPYYTHSHSLVDAVNELMPYLSAAGKSYFETVLAISMLILSLYGIRNQLFISIFTGILSRSLGDVVTAKLPRLALDNYLNTKQVIGWAIGLSVQIGLDLVMGAEGVFWISYVGGTSFQSLTSYAVAKFQHKIIQKEIQQKYPASISFVTLMVEDISYFLGALLANYSKRELKQKPMLEIEKPMPIMQETKPQKLINTAKSATSSCSVPKGSYLTTCTVEGKNYITDDIKLSGTDMCEFNLNCETLDSRRKITTFYIQKSMRDCVTYLENCDGQPVIRTQDERKCLTAESAKSYSSDNSVGKGTECHLPLGTYENSCQINSKRYYSRDAKLAQTLMCEFEVDCKNDAKETSKTVFYIQSALRRCITFFENCDGSLVLRANNEQLCKNAHVRKEHAAKYKFTH